METLYRIRELNPMFGINAEDAMDAEKEDFCSEKDPLRVNPKTNVTRVMTGAMCCSEETPSLDVFYAQD